MGKRVVFYSKSGEDVEPGGRKEMGVTCAECAHFICLFDQPTTGEFSVPCPSRHGRAWYQKSALRSQIKVDWAAWLGARLREDEKILEQTTVLRYVAEKISATIMPGPIMGILQSIHGLLPNGWLARPL
jgi:hypothetical protein